MKKEEFDKKYPHGLNAMIYEFQKSLYEIMTTEEIDKIIKQAKGKERRLLKEFRKEYMDQCDDCLSFSIWELLHAMNSTELLKDVICNMVTNCEEVFHGKDVSNF